MKAEKWLNAFVRFIALLERTGNCLGTVALLWATVVVLGGFSIYLGDDFWVATAIVFLESFRAFSRQSRSDDQLLFKTIGGIKLKRVELGSGSLYYVTAVMMTACVWECMGWFIMHDGVIPYPSFPGSELLTLLALLVIVYMLGFYTLIGKMSMKESHIVLQLCPAAALLITGLSLGYVRQYRCFDWVDYSLIPVWLAIYGSMRFGSPGDEFPFHKKVKLAAQLLRAPLIALEIYGLWTRFRSSDLLIMSCSSVLGNLQIPMATAQILLACSWLFMNETEVNGTDNKNVKLAVKTLYILVMCQGILYMTACILESLSFLLRRSLALGCGLVDKLGVECINLYYEQAYDTFLQESLFDTTKMSLVTFAVDSLNADASRDKKRAAVRILDTFLQKHKTSSSNTELVSLITTSNKTVTILISMLGWTVKEDADIRLFTAKVISHLAPYLQIAGIPGTMQKVSSLLDAQDQSMTQDIPTHRVNGNPANTGNQQVSNGSSSTTVNRNIVGQQITHGSSYSPLYMEGGGNTPTVQASLAEMMRKLWRHVKKLRSIPQEDSKDEYSLPDLGMQILQGLAHDIHNCEEISRVKRIVPMIIGFISYIPGTVVAEREKTVTLSLKLVEKLASIKGEIGITLRRELSENPFLIGNLAEILKLEGSSSYLEPWKLAMDIIAKIAKDTETRRKIGTVDVIVNKLVQEFLGGTESLKPLRAEAGEALAILATESPSNCSSMLDKANNKLIEDLTNKLQRGEHVYPAASLLHSLCENSTQIVLRHQGPNDRLASTLTMVLGRLVHAEGKQMEALIGLASKICSIMQGGITPALDSFPSDDAIVKKLVNELNAHKKPGPDESPDMRVLLLELTVLIVESCPRYSLIFREHMMMEALSNVEEYMWLGVSDVPGDLPAMVATAKGRISADTT